MIVGGEHVIEGFPKGITVLTVQGRANFWSPSCQAELELELYAQQGTKYPRNQGFTFLTSLALALGTPSGTLFLRFLPSLTVLAAALWGIRFH